MILVLTLFVSGCSGSPSGNIRAMQDEVRPLAQDHARALARCGVPECNEVQRTGYTFIRGFLIGIGEVP